MTALMDLLFSLVFLFLSHDSLTDSEHATDTASDCPSVDYATVTPSEWDALLADGWRGIPTDGTDDRIYLPAC